MEGDCCRLPTDTDSCLKSIASFLESLDGEKKHCNIQNYEENMEKQTHSSTTQKTAQEQDVTSKPNGISGQSQHLPQNLSKPNASPIDEIDRMINNAQEVHRNAAGIAFELRESFNKLTQERDQAFSWLQRSVKMLNCSMEKISTLKEYLSNSKEQELLYQMKYDDLAKQEEELNSLRESVLKQQEAFHKARERLEQDTNRVSTLRDNLEIHVETIKQKESTLEKRYYTLVGL